MKPPFPRISYEEAIKVLQQNSNPSKFGDDIGGDEETIVSNEFDRPVMVHRYPAAIKAFYMQPDADRPDLALAFDMLAPEGYGEIIGGSQRIHDYDLLVQRLREHNLPEDAFQWYLDLRRYGSAPHAGFGMGLNDGGVDLRRRAHPGSHSLPAHALSRLSLISALSAAGRTNMAQKVRIIGVPMDLGQSRRGVDMGPSALRGAGLQTRLKKLGHTSKTSAIWT